MPLDTALAMLVDEAIAPDVRRLKQAVIRIERRSRPCTVCRLRNALLTMISSTDVPRR